MEENKIIFLGTAGDSVVAGKQIRASGGIVVKIGETQIHIDPGPGALVKAINAQINPRANTAIIVSNNEHINSHDVNAIIDAMTYGGLDKNGVFVGSESVINGNDQEMSKLSQFHKSCLEKIIVFEPKKRIAIEDVEIHGIKVEGKDETGIGFKILAPKFTLGYTSNTKYFKDLAKDLEDCEIIIANVRSPSGKKEEFNLNTDEIIKIITKARPRLVILTHFGYNMVKADPLEEVRKIQKETGVQVLMAKDGFSIMPDSYSANSKQKRLNSFKEGDEEEKEIDKDNNYENDQSNNGQITNKDHNTIESDEQNIIIDNNDNDDDSEEVQRSLDIDKDKEEN